MTRTDPADGDALPERFQVDFTGQTLLGQYRIERRLADGGMGSVYLAEDANLGRKVVVKVPHVRFLGEPGFRARFRREIEELVRLEHPHVVRILARGEHDGIPFFVLQYLGGGSLEDRLAKGVESPEGALGWLGTIAETLDFVHGRGVVHRDVKPANILFDEAGHVFLSDFGVVKALGEAEGAELTAAGTGIGSPLYMAPEQGMGRGVSPASDQYALASALYEALAGAPPYGRGSVVEILVRKGREDAPSLRAQVPALPEACGAAVARALSREPEQRFPTCRAFAEAYRRGLGLDAPPAPPRSRAPVLVALAAVLALLAAAGLTRGFGLWREAPVVAPPAPPRGEEPMILLKLRGAGTEPRRLLRWTFTPKDRQRWVSRMEHSQTTHFDDRLTSTESGVTEQEIEVEVTDVDAEGRARLAWTFHVERALLEGGATPETVAAHKQLADAVGKLTGTSLLTPAGVSYEVALRHHGAADPKTQRYLQGLEETMGNMSTRLPDDPVGVGAEWETTQIKDFLGVRYQETAKFKVTGLDGQRLSIEFEFDAEAPGQQWTYPGVPKDKLRILDFRFRGKGSSTVDLARVAPIANGVKGDVLYVVEAQPPHKGTVRFQQTFEMRNLPR